MDKNAPGYKGFKDYTSRFLKVYDRFVIGFMVPKVWRTTAEPSVALYRDHIGHRHLDVGPGTGFLIAESGAPPDMELTLVDPNPDVLEYCATELADRDPTLVKANILEPLPLTGPYNTAGLAHVLHCLPGPMASKSRAVRHIAAVLADDGVLFGGTVLGQSADHSLAARAVLWVANLQGAFGNRDDDVDGLRHVLEESFEEVDISTPSPSMAYFVASRPRRP